MTFIIWNNTSFVPKVGTDATEGSICGQLVVNICLGLTMSLEW